MEIAIKTTKREEIIDITEKIKEIVEGSEEAKNGKAVLIYVPHATCSIIINESYDENVREDILFYLRKQIPQGIWKHDKIDNNADAHIKSSLIGASQIVPLEKGKLQLGRWQGIGLAEFDGPRERKVIVKIL